MRHPLGRWGSVEGIPPQLGPVGHEQHVQLHVIHALEPLLALSTKVALSNAFPPTDLTLNPSIGCSVWSGSTTTRLPLKACFSITSRLNSDLPSCSRIVGGDWSPRARSAQNHVLVPKLIA